MTACGLCRNCEKNFMDEKIRKCGINQRRIGKNITTKPHWCPIHKTKSYHSPTDKSFKPLDMCDLMCGR